LIIPPKLSEQLELEGFAILHGVFSSTEIDGFLEDLTRAITNPIHQEAALRGPKGSVYAARNLADLWPAVTSFWRTSLLRGVLEQVLGPRYGLVRTLYFDKPPGESWALPWHKDLTIAVRDNQLLSSQFRCPTSKAGVPHVEAPPELLQKMLTARLHLDNVTEQNGPLRVIPGSHHSGKATQQNEKKPHSILANRGDVLLIRPLLTHGSGKSDENTGHHRRILHFEFAASPELPDGYAWHSFLAGNEIPADAICLKASL
jgi:hypothetical protein